MLKAYFILFTGALTFILSFGSCIFVLKHNPRKEVNVTWALFSLVVALWGMGLFFGFRTNQNEIALFWGRFLNTVAILIPIFYLHFVYAFVDTPSKKRVWLWISYFVSIFYFLIAIAAPSLFVKSVSPKGGLLFYPDAGITYFPFPIWMGLLVTWGVIKLFQERKDSKGQKREQLSYLLLALIIGFSGGGTTFPLVFNINIFPFGAIGVAILDVIFTYTIIRHRLLDIEVAVSNTFARATTLFIVGGGYIALVNLQQLYIPALHFNLFLVFTVLYILVTGTFFQSLFARIQATADQRIVTTLYDLKTVTRELSAKLQHSASFKDIFDTLLHTLTRKADLELSLLWMAKDFEDEREISDTFMAFDVDTGVEQLGVMDPDDPVFQVITLDQRTRFRSSDQGSGNAIYTTYIPDLLLRKSLEDRGIGAMLPLYLQGKLIGVIGITKRQWPNASMDKYIRDDDSLFEVLSQQLVFALHNLRNNALKTDESTKSAVLWRINMQMVHDLRHFITYSNVIFDIAKTCTPEQLHATTEQLDEIKSGFVTERKSANRIIDKVLDLGAEGRQPTWIAGGINDVVSESFSNLKPTIDLHLNLGENLPYILYEKFDLELTIRTLTKNASESIDNRIHQAVDEGDEARRKQARDFFVSTYEVAKKNHLRQGFGGHTKREVCLEFRDTGTGMTEEKRDALFTEYKTTKAGTGGIGMRLLNRVIRDHNGRVEVDSELGVGTTFRLYFPVHEEELEKESEPTPKALNSEKGRVFTAPIPKPTAEQIGYFTHLTQHPFKSIAFALLCIPIYTLAIIQALGVSIVGCAASVCFDIQFIYRTNVIRFHRHPKRYMKEQAFNQAGQENADSLYDRSTRQRLLEESYFIGRKSVPHPNWIVLEAPVYFIPFFFTLWVMAFPYELKKHAARLTDWLGISNWLKSSNKQIPESIVTAALKSLPKKDRLEKNKKLVLVVEDDLGSVNDLRQTLEATQMYQVIQAGTGIEGLARVRQYQRWFGYGNNRIACVILDLRLPELDGLGFLEQLRTDEYVHSLKRRLPVIVTSSYETRKDWLRAVHWNVGRAVGYLVKPFTRNEMNALLEQVVIQGDIQTLTEKAKEKLDERWKELE